MYCLMWLARVFSEFFAVGAVAVSCKFVTFGYTKSLTMMDDKIRLKVEPGALQTFHRFWLHERSFKEWIVSVTFYQTSKS